MPIDVLVPTLTGREPGGLEYVPDYGCATVDLCPGWANAANHLLDISDSDVLLMDDDITLTLDTFTLFEAVKPHADIIGFMLAEPPTETYPLAHVHSAGAGLVFLEKYVGLVPPQGDNHVGEVRTPAYVAHVSASCMFIKRRVIESGLRFPEWPGQLYEDVRFTVEAWLQGFRVAYCPGLVFHEHSAAKNRENDPEFEARMQQNYDLLAEWLVEIGIDKRLKDGEVPYGRQPIPQVPVPEDTPARGQA